MIGLITDIIRKRHYRSVLSTDAGLVDSVTFNATTSYTKGETSDVTEHAVEEGAPLSDNIKGNVFTISLSCVVAEHRQFIAMVPIKDHLTHMEGSPRDRYNKILNWKRDKEKLYFWSDELYEDCYITDISETKSYENGNGIEFDLTLQQIITATGKILGSKDKGFTDKVPSLDIDLPDGL